MSRARKSSQIRTITTSVAATVAESSASTTRGWSSSVSRSDCQRAKRCRIDAGARRPIHSNSQRRDRRAMSIGTTTIITAVKPTVEPRIAGRSAAGKTSRNAISPTRLTRASRRKSSSRSSRMLNSAVESALPRSRRYHARTKSPDCPGVAAPANCPMRKSTADSRSESTGTPSSAVSRRQRHAFVSTTPGYRASESRSGIQRTSRRMPPMRCRSVVMRK